MGARTKRFASTLAALIAAFILSVVLATVPAPVDAEETEPADKVLSPDSGAVYSSTEMLVVFQEGTSDETIAEVIQNTETADPQGEMVDGTNGELDSSYVLETPMDEVVVSVVIDGETPYEEAAADIASSEDVLFVQPNYIYMLCDLETEADETYVDVGTDDPFQYGSRKNNWHLGAINAGAAWTIVKTNASITVAVIDTGCDLKHPDLMDNLDTDHAYQAVTANEGTTFDYAGETYTFTERTAGRLVPTFGTHGDIDTHGTHVCGIIGATANNGIGVAGVSYNATVLPINIFNTATAPSGATIITADTATVVSAYTYLFGLVDSGEVSNLRVINMSFGGYEDYNNDVAMHNAIAKALNSYGILTVVSAGNSGSSASSWPSDYEECISVTAIQQINWETNPTPWYGSDFNSAKDIAAPGASVLSTIPNGSYGNKSGTSMAAPVVSGTLALIFAADPLLSAEEARAILYETATDLMDEGRDDYTGWGLVNAEAAVGAVSSRVPVPTAKTGLVYTGAAQTGVLSGSGYTVTGGSATNAGTYTATATLGDGYVWTDGTTDDKTISWEIARAPLSTATISRIADQTYTGSALKPAVTVKVGTRTLSSGTDYTAAYTHNTLPGTATVTVTGKGNYTGTATSTFRVVGPFEDVSAVTDHYTDILWMYANGITTGFVSKTGVRTFRPYADIARCDMAAFLYRMAGSPSFTPTAADKAAFSDVNEKTPHAKEIWWLAHTGISTGFSDGTFRPYESVARCDMAAFLYRLAGSPSFTPSTADKASFTDVTATTPHAKEVWWLARTGVSTGFEDGTFRCYSNIARCDMAAFLHRMDTKHLVKTSW